MVKKLFLAFILLPLAALAEEPQLDKAPVDQRDFISIQRGARSFVNYCLTCHNAAFMRYSRLQDLRLTEQEIKDNLMFARAKNVGETMTVSMDRGDAKNWFGAAPPDLSVIARSRGADWLYTYLRGFYRDPTTHTGWNNVVFPKVGMPHVLYQLQGEQVLKSVETTDMEGHKMVVEHLELAKPGALSKNQYDEMVADLVNYLVYMGEPGYLSRIRWGAVTLLFLGIMLVFSYLLKREFWKDVH